MDYQRIYDALMARAVQLRGRPKTQNSRKSELDYVIHHVIPASFFPGGRANLDANQSDNLVYLTNREHFLAHWLLARLHCGSMSLAFAYMCTAPGAQRVTSRVYQRHYLAGTVGIMPIRERLKTA